MKNRALLFVLVSLCLATCGPAWSGLQATPTEDKVTYNFVWSGCTLDGALKDLYTRFGVSTIAIILGNERFPASMNPFKTFPNLVPPALASDLNRDTTPIGISTVFYPYRLRPQDEARKIIMAQLVTSLTPEQLNVNTSGGGIPYKSLTANQQKWARELASIATSIGARFPEPVFTQRLEQSRLILALHATVRFGYTTARASSGSTISCDKQATPSLFKPWQAGQTEAWKLSGAAQTEPGDDAPGTATKTKLAGTYTVKTLTGVIQDGCPLPIKCDPGYSTLRVAAYGEVTKATLARAVALATGGEWYKSATEWRLRTSSLTNVIASYDPSKQQEYYSQLSAYNPALLSVVQSGKLRLVADPEWTDPGLVKTMVMCGPVDLGNLTADQKRYLKDGYDSHIKTYKVTDAPADLSQLKYLTWSPGLKLYIATENSILYSEWITYK